MSVKNELGNLAKYNIAAVFQKIGGIDAMVAWAQANATEFYKLYARLVPLDVKAEGDVTIITKTYIMEKDTGRVIDVDNHPKQLESKNLPDASLVVHAERGQESGGSVAPAQWQRLYSDELDSESESGEGGDLLAHAPGEFPGEESNLGREE